MKIIAGTWRGRSLFTPAGADTRPTSARAREGLFSMLLSELGTFDGLRVIDLFAGTGALGLEALSRGAAHCTFIERSRPALTALQANIEKLDAAGRCTVLPRSAPVIGRAQTAADLAFLDAPYGASLTAPTLAALIDDDWLAPGAMVSAEITAGEPLETPGYEPVKDRRYGKARIVLLRRPV